VNAPRHSRSGFTLVEVSLALLIVAVGMLGTLAVIPQGSRAAKDAREDTFAAMVSQSALSSLRGHIQKGLPVNTWRYQPDSFSVSGPFQMTGNLSTGKLSADVYVFRDAAKKIPMGMVRVSYARTPDNTGNHRLMLTYFRGDYQVYESRPNIPSAQARIFSCMAGPLKVTP
jgi:prepilin-type N-terminal cleavage/methylation domain-containing protein